MSRNPVFLYQELIFDVKTAVDIVDVNNLIDFVYKNNKMVPHMS